MLVELTGLTALVTGSTRGIGYGTALRFAESGAAAVIINGRSGEAVDDALTSLRQAVPGAVFRGVVGDLSTAEGSAAIIAAEPEIDVLVSNAAVFEWVPFAESSDELWQREFDLNVMSGVRLARHYLPRMLERGWGRIVLIASEAGLHVPPDMVHYGVTKAAEIALARGLAELTRGTDVTVNSVVPGPTSSSGADDFLAAHAAEHDIDPADASRHLVSQIRPTSLIARMADVDEVVNMIVYISSRLSSATNGAALRVEGGILRHPG